jgi:RimJ/RimL family protein N-acetyltransferase
VPQAPSRKTKLQVSIVPFYDLFDKLPPLDTGQFTLHPIELPEAAEIAERLSPGSIPWRLMAELPNPNATAAERRLPAVESNLMAEPFSIHHLPPWRVERSRDAAVVGACVFLTWNIPDLRAELACVLASDLEPEGSREIISSLIDFGFGTIGLNRIEARCERGDRVMTERYERAGMRPEAVLRQQVRAAGGFRDMVLFAMLKVENQKSKTE